MNEDIHIKPCEIVVPLGDMTWVDRISDLYGKPINDVENKIFASLAKTEMC